MQTIDDSRDRYWYIHNGYKQLHALSEENSIIYTNTIASLKCLWAIEDIYEVFLSSVFDLEHSLLTNSLRHQIFEVETNSNELQIASELSSKLATLLFSGRSYEQAARKMVKQAFPEFSDEFDSIFKKAKEDSFEYRLMYALRNCMAHEHTAIIRITIGSVKQFDESSKHPKNSRQRYFIRPKVAISDLLDFEKLKGNVKPNLREMIKTKSYIDFRSYWRVYASQLCYAQKFFRQKTEMELHRCLSIVSEAEKEHDAEDPSIFLHLFKSSIASGERGQPFDRRHFERIRRRRDSVETPVNLLRSFVSNDISEDISEDICIGKVSGFFVPRE